MKEYRYSPNKINFRSEGDGNSRKISGYAIVFNSESYDLGGFTEIISPDCLNGVLEKSDVLYLLDHNISRGVLARCRYGSGSLSLTIDEKGLKYECELPNTALGDEVLEALKRGDITQSSFGFTCAEDEWVQRPDGSILRTIKQIDELFDVSSVYYPAYGESSVQVDTRGLQSLLANTTTDENIIPEHIMKKNKRNAEEVLDEVKRLMRELEDNIEEEEVKEDEDETSEKEEEIKSEDPEPEDEETKSDDDSEKEKETCNDEEPEDEETKSEEDKPKEENNKRNITKMKNFSLLKTINDIANKRNLDENAQAIIKEGRSIAQKAGLTGNGQIVLPMDYIKPETRTAGVFATVATQGQENVAEDKYSILEPLRAAMVLNQAGATYLTGLVGNVSIPTYSGSSVAWKGEVAAAANGEGEFGEIELSPKRLTSVLHVSMQFLQQDGNGAEELLKRDIVNAIAEKLEATILGAAAGSTTQPKGLLNGVTADTTAVKFSDVVDMEATLDNANVTAPKAWIVSPAAKAAFRTTSKDSGSGRFVMENNEIEGLPVYCTSNVAVKGAVLAAWNELVIGSWGGIELTVDAVSKADEGIVRIIVNSFWDAQVRRPEAFVKRVLK